MISKHKRLKMYCRDDLSKIENYEQAINDKENKWVCHHRLELTLEGEEALSQKDLMRMGMYYNRPYFELIFLTNEEHTSLHFKKRTKSEKHRKAISESRKGKPHPMNRKIWNPVTEFGKKYREQYGIKKRDNIKLWNQEYGYYRRTGKIRWEEQDK